MKKEDREKLAKTKLDEVTARIEALKSSKDAIDEKVKEIYDKNLWELEGQRDSLKEKFAALKDASEEGLEEAQELFSKALESLNQLISKVSSSND